MLSSGGETNKGLRPAGLPHRRAPLLIVLLIPLLACLGTATAAQGRYGLRGPAPSRALAADGRRPRQLPTSVAGGGECYRLEDWDAYEECEPDHGSSESRSWLLWSRRHLLFSCSSLGLLGPEGRRWVRR